MPVTVSRKNAAIVCGPSSWITSSRFAERELHGVPAALDAVIRIGNVDDARNARLCSPAPRIAGQRDRAGGAAVVRAVAREDLVTARCTSARS